MAARDWPDDVDVRVRAGIHGGRPNLTEAGYVGLSVHTVARVCTAGHGGQIIVTEYGQDGGEGPDASGMRFRSLGDHRLSGLGSAAPVVPGPGQGPRDPLPTTTHHMILARAWAEHAQLRGQAVTWKPRMMADAVRTGQGSPGDVVGTRSTVGELSSPIEPKTRRHRRRPHARGRSCRCADRPAASRRGGSG